MAGAGTPGVPTSPFNMRQPRQVAPIAPKPPAPLPSTPVGNATPGAYSHPGTTGNGGGSYQMPAAPPVPPAIHPVPPVSTQPGILMPGGTDPRTPMGGAAGDPRINHTPGFGLNDPNDAGVLPWGTPGAGPSPFSGEVPVVPQGPVTPIGNDGSGLGGPTYGGQGHVIRDLARQGLNPDGGEIVQAGGESSKKPGRTSAGGGKS
jgi:hypothetical protein